MARLGSKVTRSELSTIQKNTFSDGILWWNRSHTSFLGLIGYMVRSGVKLFRTKTFLNFASKALSNLFLQKTRFRFEFMFQIVPYLFSWPNGLDRTIGGKSVPEWSLTHPENTFLVGIFWWNRPHTTFLGLIGYMVHSGVKFFRTKSLLNFASKALSNSFFQKTHFRFEFLC